MWSAVPASVTRAASPSRPEPRVGEAREPVDGARGTGFEQERNADRDDGIEHRPGVPGERTGMVERGGMRDVAAATDELHAIGFAGRSDALAVDNCRVKQPGPRLVARAGPAGREDRAARRVDLGLDEELAEGGVRRIGSCRREDDLRIAGDAEAATPR